MDQPNPQIITMEQAIKDNVFAEKLESVMFNPVRAQTGKNGTRKYHGRLIRAGYTRNILNEKTDIFVEPDAIQTAVNAGLFEGLACFIDHVSPGNNPSMRNLLGSWHTAQYDHETRSAAATLTTYVTDDTKPIIDRLDLMLSADAPSPDVGVSLVFYPEWNTTTGERHVSAFKQIESADIVFFPAADGRILEALSARDQMEVNMSDEVQTAAEETAVEPLESQAKKKIEKFSTELDTLAAEQQEREELSAVWADEIAQQGIQTILKNSGLPEPVKQRLAKVRYNSPEELYDAIREAAEELQALDSSQVVDMGERPWIYTKDPQDNIKDHVDWFFGTCTSHKNKRDAQWNLTLSSSIRE